MKKEIVYGTANEKYVRAVVLYADADDGHLFYDKEHSTNKVPYSEAKNLFIKGMMVVVLEGKFYKPVSMTDNTTTVAINLTSGESAEVYTVNSDTDKE